MEFFKHDKTNFIGGHTTEIVAGKDVVFYDQPAQQMNPFGVHSAHHPHRGDLSAKADYEEDEDTNNAFSCPLCRGCLCDECI